jgi:hypothetical protein
MSRRAGHTTAIDPWGPRDSDQDLLWALTVESVEAFGETGVICRQVSHHRGERYRGAIERMLVQHSRDFVFCLRACSIAR